MPATAAEVLQEFELESATTRRLLERVPADQLNWKPHPKSRSAGQLALHVAVGPGLIGQWALQDSMEVPNLGKPPEPTSSSQILAAHDDSVQKVKAAVLALGDAGWEHCGNCRRMGQRSWYCRRGSSSVPLR